MNKIAVLCDFDGTVADDDVGNLLFRTFADERRTRPLVDKWKRGEISSRECLAGEAAHARVTRDALNAFVDQRLLDPYFKDFVDFAHRQSMELAILSDGMDYYIDRMLLRNGLGAVEFFSNTVQIRDGKLEVEFPHYDKMDCRDCGNCKTHHLEKFRAQGFYIVYVGNGLSDTCPSTYSDLVFAKGDLLDFCRSNDINHVAFSNFRDVEKELVKRLILNESPQPIRRRIDPV